MMDRMFLCGYYEFAVVLPYQFTKFTKCT